MPSGNILIIEDDIKLLSLLSRIISLEGYKVIECPDIKSASKILEKEQVDVTICDVKLPDGNGVEFVKYFKAKYPFNEIILLTAFGNIQDGVEAIKSGAFNYLLKGEDNDKLLPIIQQAFEKINLHKKVQHLERKLHTPFDFNNILGESFALKQTIALAKKVSPTDATVLLLGETGTGKELFAKAIHKNSTRFMYPFVALNCSAFPKDLLESELFGHKAGSFTGAIKNKKGLIEEADQGTLFLDEIGEMDTELQSKLLRVLESSEFIKVGDTKPTKVDIRLISATNRDLTIEVREGRFREDLLYRLNTFSILIPPLRDRKSDIPLLAKAFVRFFAKKTNKHIDEISKDFMYHLQQHAWKGNVRELRNVIERAVLMSENPELTVEDLPYDLQVVATTLQNGHAHTVSAFNLESAEKLHIHRVLNHTRGNKVEAAKLLNIGLATLYRKIEAYKLQHRNDSGLVM